MRKVDIQQRVLVLNQQLQLRRATAASQEDERRRLIEACRDAGDHVPVPHWTGAEVVQACAFCRVQLQASDQQIARNLVTGR